MTPEPAPRIGAHRIFGRTSLRAHERADLIVPGLPPELAFLPAAGFSSEQLLDAVGAAPRAIHPVDALLSEGIIREEAYYRALARHLGCQYYRGEPPFARSFDAIKGLRCGVAPLELARRGSSGGHRAARGVGAAAHPGVPVRSNSFRLFCPDLAAAVRLPCARPARRGGPRCCARSSAHSTHRQARNDRPANCRGWSGCGGCLLSRGCKI